MPIDPAIPLAAQGVPTLGNPMAVMQQAQNAQAMREERLASAQERQAQAAKLQNDARVQQQVQQQNATIDGLMQHAFTQDPDTGVSTFNRGLVQDGLVQAGMGHLYPQISDTLDKMEASSQKIAAEKRNLYASAAFGVHQAGDSPEAMLTAMASLKANGNLSPQVEAQVHQAIAANPTPEGVRAVIQQAMGSMPEYQALVNKEQERVAGLAKTNAEAASLQATAAKTGTETQQAQKVLAGTNAQGITAEDAAKNAQAAAQLRNEQAKTAIQQKTFDATYGQGKDANGQPVQSPVAQAIAEYRMPALTGRAAISGAGPAIMSQVAQINPSYDASQFPNRQRTRIAFTSGTQGQQLNAINTAIQHLDLLKQAAQAVGNGSFVPGNAIYNTVRTAFGGAAPTNLATINEAIDGEVGAVIKKGAATEGEMARQGKLSNQNSSPEQIAGRVDTTIGLLGGKANALDYQFKQAMGQNDPTQLLTPEARSVLSKASGSTAAPAEVQSILKGQKDGRYTLSDGSAWIVKGGKVTGKG